MRVLFCVLFFAGLAFGQAREVWVMLPERVNVYEAIQPGLTRDLVKKCFEAGAYGVVGPDQWSKNGSPETETKWRDTLSAILRDFPSLKFRLPVWNGSKFAYGAPDFIPTLNASGSSVVIWDSARLAPGERYFETIAAPGFRLWELSGEFSGGAAEVWLFRATPAQPTLSKWLALPAGPFSVSVHSLGGETPLLLMIRAAGSYPLNVFVRGLTEREPLANETAGPFGPGEYRYIGKPGNGFAYSRTMQPDSLRVFWQVALQQSREVYQTFGAFPNVEGAWFNLDEVFLGGYSPISSAETYGEAWRDRVSEAAFVNDYLWAADAWGFNDCLGGHNTQNPARATRGVETSTIEPDSSFLGFAWTEGGQLRTELNRFSGQTIGAGVYIGEVNLDSAAAQIQAAGVAKVLLFTWDRRALDSLGSIVPRFK